MLDTVRGWANWNPAAARVVPPVHEANIPIAHPVVQPVHAVVPPPSAVHGPAEINPISRQPSGIFPIHAGEPPVAGGAANPISRQPSGAIPPLSRQPSGNLGGPVAAPPPLASLHGAVDDSVAPQLVPIGGHLPSPRAVPAPPPAPLNIVDAPAAPVAGAKGAPTSLTKIAVTSAVVGSVGTLGVVGAVALHNQDTSSQGPIVVTQ